MLNIILFSPDVFSYIPSLAVKLEYEYTAWGRPTIGWDVDCENRGISREIGFNAFQTSLYTSGDELRLGLIGWFLVFVPLALSCFGICMIAESEASACCYLTFSRLSMWIMFIFVFLRLYATRNDMELNIDSLEEYSVLKECGDEYSYINTE